MSVYPCEMRRFAAMRLTKNITFATLSRRASGLCAGLRRSAPGRERLSACRDLQENRRLLGRAGTADDAGSTAFPRAGRCFRAGTAFPGPRRDF